MPAPTSLSSLLEPFDELHVLGPGIGVGPRALREIEVRLGDIEVPSVEEEDAEGHQIARVPLAVALEDDADRLSGAATDCDRKKSTPIRERLITSISSLLPPPTRKRKVSEALFRASRSRTSAAPSSPNMRTSIAVVPSG